MTNVGSGIRVFPQLRAAHLDEIDARAPRVTLYFSTNYDLTDRQIPDHCHYVTTMQAIRFLWTSRERVLELPEPLWLRFFPCWLALAITWKLRSAIHRGRGQLVFFAIENNNLQAVFFGGRATRPFLSGLLATIFRLVIVGLVDRCAFGTQSAAETYAPLVGSRSPQRRITVDLLAPRHQSSPKMPHSVVFIGALEDRKGIIVLLNSWTIVESRLRDAVLHIVGNGPHRRTVETWVATQPRSRRYHGPLPRNMTLKELSAGSVLVAPSLPDGRWREQIGRPIQEALASGLTVVTTTETGLATYLQKHGHHVIPVDLLNERLATEIVNALLNPLDPERVLSALPKKDGRLVADQWLHS